jgi:hypothetical protein
LTLIVDGRRVPLTAVGPDHVTTLDATEFHPGRGKLQIAIDGGRSLYGVELPTGAVPFDRQIPIRILRPDGQEPAPLKPLPSVDGADWIQSPDDMRQDDGDSAA